MEDRVRETVRTELSVSYLVEAGAGTGKTSLLVGRILEALRRGMPLTRMCIVTFTRAAAADLRERLRTELVRQPGRPAWARRALDSLERAAISTIHSLAEGILREHALDAGLPPDFALLDDVDRGELLERIWGKWLTGSEGMGIVSLGEDIPTARLISLRDAVLNEADAVLEGGLLPEPVPFPVPGDVFAAAEPMLAELQELMGRVRDDSDPGYREAERILGEWREMRDWPREVQIRYLRQLAEVRILGRQENWQGREAARRLKEIFRELRSQIQGFREKWGRAAATTALEELRKFAEHWRKAKRRLGKVDFQDLLWLARNLLRDNPRVRRELQQRYRMVLVDEFQDTDPLQAEMVFFLAEDGAEARSWETVNPTPGKLFLVGDPKQSIYRFRRADIEMFESVRERLETSGTVVRIERNYRSRAEMLDWVNGVFSELIRRPADGLYQAEYHPLRPARGEAGRAVWYLRSEAAENREAGRRVEAEALAGAVVALREGREPFGEGLSLGRMAVLLPNFSNLDMYRRALERRGVPTVVPTGRAFYREPEVQAVIQVLRAVEGPATDARVVGALRSALFGVSDEELLLWRSSGRNFDASLPANRLPEGPVAEGLRMIWRWHREKNRLGPRGLLERILGETGFRRLLWEVRPEALGQLERLKDLAAHFDTSRSFVEHLSRRREEGAAESSAPASSPEFEAVRILTIHGAKGLEFDAVFLADLAAGSAGETPLLVDRSSGRVEARLGPDIVTAGYAELLERERRRREEEEKRLLYVAATRAREHLVISLIAGGAPAGLARFLRGVELPPAPELPWWKWARERIFVARPVPDGWDFAPAEVPAEEETAPAVRGEGERFGRAVHLCLERLPFGAPPAEIRDLCQEARRRMGVAASPEQLAKAVWSVLEQSVMRRAAASPRVLREVPYVHRVGDGYEEGRIDLLFEEEGGLVIVDYKTGLSTERTEEYRSQAEKYRAAVTEITGRPVREVVFVLAGESRELRLI